MIHQNYRSFSFYDSVFNKRGEFFRQMKAKVYNYFEETNQNPKFHWIMLVRYFLVLTSVLLPYYLQFYYEPVRNSLVLSVICSIIMGFGCAQIGLLPMHDASHCSFTNKPWVWRLLGSLHDVLNGSSFLAWCYRTLLILLVEHQLGHHIYTNIYGADPDIDAGDPDIRRIVKYQKWYLLEI